MKTFVALCIMTFGLSVFFKQVVLNEIYGEKAFRIPKSNSVLFLGDSHSQYALKDNIIPEARNYSLRSEKFIWTYFKLNKFLQSNDHIEKIFLSVSYHSFSKANEDALVGKNDRSFFYSRYGHLLDEEGYSDLFDLNLANTDLTITYLKYIVGIPFEGYKEFNYWGQEMLSGFNHNKLSFWGKYQSDDKNHLNSKINEETIKSHFSEDGKSTIQIKYLTKIIKLAEEKGLEINLITTPVHPLYLRSIPIESKMQFKLQVGEVKKQFDGRVKHYNFSRFKLPKIAYKDFDHLNSLGAKIFTDVIRKNKEMF